MAEDCQTSMQQQTSLVFPDAEAVLVLPPLNYAGNALEYCRLLASGKIEGLPSRRRETENELTRSVSGDGDSESHHVRPLTQRTSSVLSMTVNQRQTLLQGELLDVAAIVTPTSAEEPSEEWFQKYSGLKGSVDLVVMIRRSGSMKGSGDLLKPETKTSAIAKVLWEAQVFPIDAPDRTSVSVHPLVEEKCIVYAFQTPLTINPKYLENPLVLQVALSARLDMPITLAPNLSEDVGGVHGVSSIASLPSAGQTATLPLMPLNAVLHADVVKETKALQEVLQAPTPFISLGIPYSSALTGGLYTGKAFGEPYNFESFEVDRKFGSFGSDSPPHNEEDEEADEENHASRNIELLDLAIVQPAVREANCDEFGGVAGDGGAVEEELILSCNVEVQKPLSLTTTRIDSLIYLQIENVTRDTTVTIENVHFRGLNTYTQGELPFALRPGEQYSLLLCIDEDLHDLTSKNPQAPPSWEVIKAPDAASGGGNAPAVTNKVGLPFYLKWRTTEGHGPSVWSNSGADIQLPVRTPMEVSITCLSCCQPGGILTAIVTVTNHEQHDVDITVSLPRDIHYHRGSSQKAIQSSPSSSYHDAPALIPLLTRRTFGVIPKSGSQSAHFQFLTTRLGLHSFPTLCIIDSVKKRRFSVRGGQVVVS